MIKVFINSQVQRVNPLFIKCYIQGVTSNKMNACGYQRERFPNLPSDSFECIICSQVVREPWECHQCGKMFCKACITDWLSKKPASNCPSRCQNSKIAPITSKALLRLYNDLDVKCSNAKCEKIVKLIDLEKHENFCLKVKCWNFDNCEQVQNQSIKSKEPCCSQICQTLFDLKANFGNVKKMYSIIDHLFKKPDIVDIGPLSSNTDLCWDPAKLGTGIQLSNINHQIFLKEQSYVFRSAIANIGFNGGVNYWEIMADKRTENELKIGVTCSRDFDLNSAFCDNAFGFAYYGLGQLRHSSNASGPQYGKRFKKDGVLGCCLNMETGTLSFALNGEYWGVAYKDDRLKKGPIYPAVSLLHCAGCTIRSGMKVPQYFKD